MGQINKRDNSFNDYTKANQTSKSRKMKPTHVNLQIQISASYCQIKTKLYVNAQNRFSQNRHKRAC